MANRQWVINCICKKHPKLIGSFVGWAIICDCGIQTTVKKIKNAAIGEWRFLIRNKKIEKRSINEQ